MEDTLFKEKEVVIYVNGDRFELGIIKTVIAKRSEDEEQDYFVNYHTGDTAARTPEHTLHKLTNAYAFDIKRLDTEGHIRSVDALDKLLYGQSGYEPRISVEELGKIIRSDLNCLKKIKRDFYILGVLNVKDENGIAKYVCEFDTYKRLKATLEENENG